MMRVSLTLACAVAAFLTLPLSAGACETDMLRRAATELGINPDTLPRRGPIDPVDSIPKPQIDLGTEPVCFECCPEGKRRPEGNGIVCEPRGEKPRQ